ncbi:MAG: hypothetical protein JWP29_5618 [Rhodoferax sp.]|nr:hypothetical protein [Rhodoferax sp.]
MRQLFQLSNQSLMTVFPLKACQPQNLQACHKPGRPICDQRFSMVEKFLNGQTMAQQIRAMASA